MKRGYLKTVVFVECLCVIMQCMYQQGSDTSVLRNCHRAIHRILQQRPAQLEALGAYIDGKSRENHYWDWVRHVAPDRAGGVLMRNSASSHRIIAKNVPIRINHGKSAAGSA